MPRFLFTKIMMPEGIPTPQIIRTRRKTVALVIDLDGSLIVRAPLRLSQQRIMEIINQKASWIRSRRAQIINRQAASITHKFLPGEKFWYLGQRYSLQFVANGTTPLVLSTHFLLDQRYQPRAGQIFETWYRKQARLVFTERVSLVARQLGIEYHRLRLSSARTRWGSCSSLGTISLVWRLVMAPISVIDYVVLHELMHIRVHNHSKTFWNQIESVMPDYRTHINWLKSNGNQLRL